MSTATADPFDHEAALEACARGERFALRALYDHEARWLFGVTLRIVRDHETAQDVLQEAFLLIWQRASQYQRSLGSARGWIYTVVRHRALDEARRRRLETPAGDDLEALSDAAVLRDLGTEPDRASAIEHCLQALDERKRDCIVAAFVEGHTYEQIAQHLAAPLGSVKSWIRRGLLALKECLS